MRLTLKTVGLRSIFTKGISCYVTYNAVVMNDCNFVLFMIHTSSIGTVGCLLNDSIICLGWLKTLLQKKTKISVKQFEQEKGLLWPCFLASGEPQQSLSLAYLIGILTLSCFIRETCDATFEALACEYLHPPSSTEWENIGCDLQETWNLPHVVGAIDGKHIRIQCPKQSGTFFIIIKDSSVLYCWQFVILATASQYLMLVSMEAITMLEC